MKINQTICTHLQTPWRGGIGGITTWKNPFSNLYIISGVAVERLGHHDWFIRQPSLCFVCFRVNAYCKFISPRLTVFRKHLILPSTTATSSKLFGSPILAMWWDSFQDTVTYPVRSRCDLSDVVDWFLEFRFVNDETLWDILRRCRSCMEYAL